MLLYAGFLKGTGGGGGSGVELSPHTYRKFQYYMTYANSAMVKFNRLFLPKKKYLCNFHMNMQEPEMRTLRRKRYDPVPTLAHW